jgi:hypothetical protein
MTRLSTYMEIVVQKKCHENEHGSSLDFKLFSHRNDSFVIGLTIKLDLRYLPLIVLLRQNKPSL